MRQLQKDPIEPDGLERIRQEITRLDERLVRLLAERVGLARRAGNEKSQSGIDLHDPVREAEVIRHAAVEARGHGLNPEPVRDVYWQILKLSRTAQEAIR